MVPYLILYLLTCYMALMHMRPDQIIHSRSFKLTWMVAFVLLTLMIGLRHEVGADWDAYLQYVEYMKGEDLKEIFHGDPAYLLLNWMGANIGGEVYFVNLICASLFSWGLIKFCREQPRPWLALFIATPFLTTVVAMGYTRQGVAIGLAMLAITKLDGRSIYPFICWIIIASLFHKSAIVLLPLALFAQTSNKFLSIIGIFVSVVLMSILVLHDQLSYLLNNYIETEYSSSGAAVRIFMNAVPAVLYLVFAKRFAIVQSQMKFWTWMAWGAILLIPVLFVFPSSTVIDRFALYWIPIQIFILTRLPDAVGVKYNRNPIWVLLIVIYYSAVMLTWLFFAEHATSWIPYSFYPWVAIWK